MFTSQLTEFVLPLPPLAEQARIVDALERLAPLSDRMTDELEVNLRRLARLRQSILHWAFEGKLVDQDPADERAAMLLGRIKAERAAAEANGNGRRRTPRAGKEAVG